MREHRVKRGQLSANRYAFESFQGLSLENTLTWFRAISESFINLYSPTHTASRTSDVRWARHEWGAALLRVRKEIVLGQTHVVVTLWAIIVLTSVSTGVYLRLSVPHNRLVLRHRQFAQQCPRSFRDSFVCMKIEWQKAQARQKNKRVACHTRVVKELAHLARRWC